MSRTRTWIVNLWPIVLAAVLGALCTLGAQALYDWWGKRRAAAKQPAGVLREADVERLAFNQKAIQLAITKYNSVLATSGLSKELQAYAYRGLSRAYSDLTALEFRLGLPRDVDPTVPSQYAESAARLDPKASSANDIARAYALDNIKVYETGIGAENPDVDNQIRSIMLKLLPRADLNAQEKLDVGYLAWHTRATEQATTFPGQLNFNNVSSIRILTDVGLHYLDPGSKDIQRSSAICSRAVVVDSSNQVAQYCLGYADDEAGRFRDAEEHFEKALHGTNEDPYFPRARNNLGATYFYEGRYRDARNQIQCAVGTPGAPPKLRTFWLYNLGEIDLELGHADDACSEWREAADLPRSDAEFAAAWGLTQCEYLNLATRSSALRRYATAVRLACAQGYDLTDIKTFQKWHAGPQELGIATALIQSPGAPRGFQKTPSPKENSRDKLE